MVVRDQCRCRLLVPALVAVAFLVLPLVGLLIRAPGGQSGAALTGPTRPGAACCRWGRATTATGISPGARGAARLGAGADQVPGPRLLRALVTLPLVLPPVVGGVALLLAFGRTGFLGRYLDAWFGLTMPFTPVAVVMAETFVAMPFLVITVEGALRAAIRALRTRRRHWARADDGLPAGHAAASSLRRWARAPSCAGRGPWVSSAPPSPSPADFPGRPRRCPSRSTSRFETDPDAAIALSLVLLVVSVAVLVSLRDHWLRGGCSR